MDKAHSLVYFVSSGPVRNPVSTFSQTKHKCIVLENKCEFFSLSLHINTNRNISIYADTYIQNIGIKKEKIEEGILNELFIK